MKLILALLLLTTTFTTAQNQPVKIEATEQDQKLVFICTNNSAITQEVTITLTQRKGLRGYTRPITKRVAPSTTTTLASFTIAGAYNYKYSTSWKEVPNIKEQQVRKEVIAARTKGKILRDLSKINTGIVIFDNTDCPRCQRSTAYLLDNNVPFKLLNITDNKKNHKLMWDLLEAQGVTGTINTPVILVEGELSWSHEDLPAFLKSLH
jgi:glutaredoxin